MKIVLNGESFEALGPITVTHLLTQLHIDPSRVAVEHNLTVVKKAAYSLTVINEDDVVEVVNFVGGG